MNKKKCFRLISILTLSLLMVACTKKEENYIIFGISGSINIESLTGCLNKKDIDFEIDEERNVLIKNEDNERAVIYCS